MKLTIKEYAENKGITIQAVYKQIKQGKLKTIKENGKTFIIFSEEKKGDKHENLNLLLENERLKTQLEAEKEKVKLLEENYKKLLEAKEEEINTLKGAFVELRNTYNQRIKELESKIKELPDNTVQKKENRGLKKFIKWLIPD